jgi:hypothetical protein
MKLGRLLVAARPLPVCLALGWLARPSAESAEVRREPDVARALARALGDHGLIADPSEVFFVDAPRGRFASRRVVRALARARRGDEPADVYLARVELSPEGRLLSLAGTYNLSDTSAVDEKGLVVSGQRAAWVIASGDKIFTLKLADLRSEPEPTGEGWTRTARWQNSITNLQETGQRSGVGLRTFRLDPAASTLTLRFDEHALEASADGHEIRISTDAEGDVRGQRYVLEQTAEKGRPGNFVTWAVDRVRAMPWFGSDRMQLVKAVAFVAIDWFQRVVGGVTGDTGAERVKEELGGLADTPLSEFTDPETGWPPPPMEPMLKPALEGEGKWRALDKDPYILTNPQAPAPFVQGFIRTDAKRAYTQIWVLVWDPRQVALHAMSGTVEPKSATGETGPGLIPRTPEVMGRLLAGFNGGFQATHGEFGMMADGVVYLPPKPYAATVAELRDGSTGFGTWPDSEAVPDQIVSFRQNMTPLVMDGVINPYKRTWWGGVPPGWTDESRTVRSAICQTREGFVAYLYGVSIDADALALAMLRARCTYGIHLDMNPGHTGLEFYRAAPAGELPDVGHKLDAQWEAEGDVSGMPGWRFIGRRMLRYMGLMNFPRYVQRESRDFFYLTLKNVLPGADLEPRVEKPEPGEGAWKVKGLPQHGWPYAIATTWLRPDKDRPDTKVLLLRADPRTLRARRGSDEVAPTVLSMPRVEAHSGLWLGTNGFALGAMPDKDAVLLATGLASAGPDVVAALGIEPNGYLLYAEVASARDGARDGPLLRSLLDSLGVKEALYFARPWPIALGGDRDLAERALAARPDGVVLVRRDPPGMTRIFPDTPIVPVATWYPLQARRVRYFRKPKPSEPRGEPGDTTSGAEP